MSCNHNMNTLCEGKSESAHVTKSCQGSHHRDRSSELSREGFILPFLQIHPDNRGGAEDFPEVTCLQCVNLDKFSNIASGKL